ncbi:MAG TPA: hypothetical protein VJN21_09725 [Candidatus Acidoferrales bacterium]|nr:hypothetical protein [Candidatus Acidoferrales bacterium]
MAREANPRAAQARSASGDELRAFLHDASEDVLVNVLANPNLTETDLCILLERLDLTDKILGVIAANSTWKKNEGVRFRLARHPHAPRRIALQLLRDLFLFDLVQLSLSPSTPAEIRRVAEEVILRRLPHLPIGQKFTLARRGSARIAGGVLAEGHAQAASLALNNPFLNEAQILRVLSRPHVPERVVVSIAHHPRWSCQYNVRLALIRHPAAPLAAVLRFLPDVTMRDLRELTAATKMSDAIRNYLKKEIARRSAKGSAENVSSG